MGGTRVSVHFGPILCSLYPLSHLFLGTRSQEEKMPSGPCSMVLRRKFSLGTVENTEKPVYLRFLVDWRSLKKPKKKKKKKKKKCHVSHVRCQVSGVRCQVSGVRCQVSLVRRKPALGTVLHGPEENIFSRDRAPRSRGENLPSGPCSMVPRRKFILGTVLHGPEEKQKNWYNYASRWTRDLWSKGVSLILAYR